MRLISMTARNLAEVLFQTEISGLWPWFAARRSRPRPFSHSILFLEVSTYTECPVVFATLCATTTCRNDSGPCHSHHPPVIVLYSLCAAAALFKMLFSSALMVGIMLYATLVHG